ncbi:phosphotransferase (plasmid) [Diaphorobacter sp. HDW4B]|uniref:oxidoreductase family protein n=1 Tax=Diaphorobacter sp. HDW4B TaxID=2714925 RepID=UPI00140D8BD7|nr:oxidoreductase family protein [Diaphorobacter sp. HDW4B]QIL73996.1 phosphotransferase [Diaphorobacter sp. HDW4B]
MNLPFKIEDITADWLSQALSTRTPGTRVTDVQITRVIPGTTTKILLRASYADGVKADGPPQALCVKGGFDDALRPLVGDAYIAEANFFNYVAPQLNAPLPRCWYAGADVQRLQGIVILDDLSAVGVTFGEPTRAWTPDQVAAGLELQARWHAQTWGETPERFPWLHVGSWVRNPAKQLLGEGNWNRAFSDSALVQKIPTALQNRERVENAFQTMWRDDDAFGIPCLNHCDPHIGNTYFNVDGKPGFLDWQSASLAPAMDDVSYFLAGALTPEDRRAHERQLLGHYVDALGSHLGSKVDFDAMWLDYRRHLMHGFIWSVVPADMQQPENSAAMIERYVAAIEDLDTLVALKC